MGRGVRKQREEERTGRVVLVTGGVRSGKSAYACARAAACGERVLFLATCAPRPDMAERIARHRAERPAHWRTREAQRHLAGACEPGHDAIVVDCLTLLVSQMLARGAGEAEIEEEVRSLLAAPPCPLFVVTNEVGWGVHPQGELALRFVDALGRVNQAAARRADEVVLLVAGRPLALEAER